MLRRNTPRRRRSPLLPAAALCLAAATGSCFNTGDVSNSTVQLETHVNDWREEIIYQVLVDRFADANPNNDWRKNKNSLARYQGGDWQGLIDHLDYFTALGVTTLWISPIVRNVDTDAGIDGYHGYWASDLAELNPHFGDLATLRRLVREAHARGLKIVLDIVTNHMGQMFYYDINQNGRPDDNLYGGGENSQFQNPGGTSSGLTRVSEFDPDYNPNGIQSYTSLGPAGPAPVYFLNMPEIFRTAPGFDRACDPNVPLQQQPECNSWQYVLATLDGYHRRGRIVSYDPDSATPPHQTSVQVQTGDFPGGLKDVNTENPDVRAAMIQAYARWVELLDLDGFRIDTLKHVEYSFWQEFAPAIRNRLAAEGKTKFFMFGEAFDGDDQLIGSYTMPNQLDSVFYFSQKFQVYHDVFQCEQGTQKIQDLYKQRYPELFDDTRSNPSHFGTQPQPNGAESAPRDLLVNFMDNHDVPRFLAGVFGDDRNSCPNGVSDTDRLGSNYLRMRDKLHAALTYLLTEDGIPCLYYGTEQEFMGANDPSNREVVWRTARDYNPGDDTGTAFPQGDVLPDDPDGVDARRAETFNLIARLTRIRRAYPALTHGNTQFRWVTPRSGNEQDAGILAFERSFNGETVLVVINAHSAGASETSYTNMGGGPMTTGFAQGATLVDVLESENPRTVTVGPGGSATIRLDPWEALILVRQDQTHDLAP